MAKLAARKYILEGERPLERKAGVLLGPRTRGFIPRSPVPEEQIAIWSRFKEDRFKPHGDGGRRVKLTGTLQSAPPLTLSHLSPTTVVWILT